MEYKVVSGAVEVTRTRTCSERAIQDRDEVSPFRSIDVHYQRWSVYQNTSAIPVRFVLIQIFPMMTLFWPVTCSHFVGCWSSTRQLLARFLPSHPRSNCTDLNTFCAISSLPTEHQPSQNSYSWISSSAVDKNGIRKERFGEKSHPKITSDRMGESVS